MKRALTRTPPRARTMRQCKGGRGAARSLLLSARKWEGADWWVYRYRLGSLHNKPLSCWRERGCGEGTLASNTPRQDHNIEGGGLRAAGQPHGGPKNRPTTRKQGLA